MDTMRPEPREIPAGKILLAEYRELNDSNRAVVTILDKGPADGKYNMLVLYASTPGFEPAGSVARWTNGAYGVRYYYNGAFYGQRYKPDEVGLEKARAHFDRMIGNHDGDI